MEHYSEKIQDYIEGLLDGEELKSFEDKLAIDKEFRNMVSLQREVYDILNRRAPEKEQALKKTLAEVNEMYRTKASTRPLSLTKWFSLAAVACTLLVGMFFLYKGSDDTYELPIMHSEIVRGELENTSYERAVQAFNDKKYAQAEELLVVLVEKNPEQIQYAYYLALSHIGTKEWDNAINVLRPIASGPSVFSLEANYYLALAYYRKKDFDNAKMCLNKIPTGGEFGEKATKLRKKMD